MQNILLKTDQMSINDYRSKIIEVKEGVCKGLYVLGQLLYHLKESKAYEEEYDSFEAFLGDPDISFSRVTAYKAMRVYEVFGLQLSMLNNNLMTLDFDKVYRLTGVVTKENAEEWVEKAKTLSRSDLTFEIKKEKGLPALDPAKHTSEHIKEFLYKWCPERKISPDTLELEELLMTYEKFKRSMR